METIFISCFLGLIVFFFFRFFDPFLKLELVFIDETPIVNVYSRNLLFFLTTSVTSYKNLQKVFVRIRTVRTNNNYKKTIYELVLKVTEDNILLNESADPSITKDLVPLSDEIDDSELKEYCNKLNEALEKQESCSIVKDYKGYLKISVGMIVFASCVVYLLFDAFSKQNQFQDNMLIGLLYTFLFSSILLFFIILINLKIENNRNSKNKYNFNKTNYSSKEDVDVSSEADKINDFIIK